MLTSPCAISPQTSQRLMMLPKPRPSAETVADCKMEKEGEEEKRVRLVTRGCGVKGGGEDGRGRGRFAECTDGQP